jgi:hypothetical protein
MIRERGRALLKRSLANAADLLIDAACVRYFHEVGQHQVCADETFTNLDRLVTCPHLEGKRLADITDKVVTDVIAWRRGHHRWGRADLDRISPATVNRSRTEVLQKLFTHAKKKWGQASTTSPIGQSTCSRSQESAFASCVPERPTHSNWRSPLTMRAFSISFGPAASAATRNA